MNTPLFRFPDLPRGDEWATETLEYTVRPRPKSKFKTTIDAERLFSGAGRSTVTTRTRRDALELDVVHRLANVTMRDVFSCRDEAGLRPVSLARTVRHASTPDEAHARAVTVDFTSGLEIPGASYPDVLLPFLLRGGVHEGQVRTVYSWTSDSFLARVYYERRKRHRVQVPAGTFECWEAWLYPDLNDWIALGSVITRLAKPLLPRYELWLEVAAPHRLIRFEGAYGPPGAPEVVLELA